MDALKNIGDMIKKRAPLPDSAITRPSMGGRDSVPEEQSPRERVLQLLKQQLGVTDIKLEYSVGQDTGQVIVKVINADTGKIIQEIPSKELVALAKSMKAMKGLFFDGGI